MDIAVFRALNALTGHNAVLDWTIHFCASYLQYELAALLLMAAFWKAKRLRMFTAAVISAFIARGIVKTAILLVIQRGRPFVILSGVHQLVSATGEEYQSFPSGHALTFFAMAMAAYMYNKRLGWWLFAGATIMGIARVCAGVHWPSDILAGAVLGIATGYVTVRAINAYWPVAQSPQSQ